MREFLNIARALSDATRVRCLLMLGGGELCLCQIVGVLELAPSTVSRHLTLLYQAGLVERRKQGKWHYYRPAGRSAPIAVKRALHLLRKSVPHDPTVVADRRALNGVLKQGLEQACACYR